MQSTRPMGLCRARAEELMRPKAHGTCDAGVGSSLRWGADPALADRICCFNRHYAEASGSWLRTKFLREVRVCARGASRSGAIMAPNCFCPRCCLLARIQVDKAGETVFYDSVTRLPLFTAPRGRRCEVLFCAMPGRHDFASSGCCQPRALRVGRAPSVFSITHGCLLMLRTRSFAAFEAESRDHGWPSFRDPEVQWRACACLH